ncbi:helix-hairpin-helix domain-containing protein [Pontibacillus yanchengensis]|nr:helix-hairpin-helix domain-containing protein [Pontibacillus yanchengensis]
MNRITKTLAVTAAVIIVGIIVLFQQEEPQGQAVTPDKSIPISSADSSDENTHKQSNDLLFVDVKGAVVQPDVYQMKQGTRVKDAIEEAGGLRDDANPLSVNLAQKLIDEMVIYVQEEGSTSTGSPENLGSTDKIFVNQATPIELEALPGIGQAKAEAIIDYREQNGPFTSIEELMKVKGIGEKTVENFQDKIQIP